MPFKPLTTCAVYTDKVLLLVLFGTCNMLDFQNFYFVTEFYGVELWMLRKAIQALANEGKAELIPGANPDGSDAGVKFFS